MPIQLDHLMVPARDKLAAARLLAELLGVPWSKTGVGPFSPVFVNDGFTIDFDEWPEPIPRIHYCFRVSDAEFNAILARIQAAGIPYRSAVHGPVDSQVDTAHGGRIELFAGAGIQSSFHGGPGRRRWRIQNLLSVHNGFGD